MRTENEFCHSLYSPSIVRKTEREKFSHLCLALRRSKEWHFPLTSFRKDFPRWQCQIWLSMKTEPSQVITSFSGVLPSTNRTHSIWFSKYQESNTLTPFRDIRKPLFEFQLEMFTRESAQQNLFVLFLIEKSLTNMICLLACRQGHPYPHQGNQEWRIRIWDPFTCAFLLPESN